MEDFNLCLLNFLRNAVCETRSSRSAELLARYSDSILKKNAKVASDDSDKEAAMSEVVSISVPQARFKSFGKETHIHLRAPRSARLGIRRHVFRNFIT